MWGTPRAPPPVDLHEHLNTQILKHIKHLKKSTSGWLKIRTSERSSPMSTTTHKPGAGASTSSAHNNEGSATPLDVEHENGVQSPPPAKYVTRYTVTTVEREGRKRAGHVFVYLCDLHTDEVYKWSWVVRVSPNVKREMVAPGCSWCCASECPTSAWIHAAFLAERKASMANGGAS